MTNSKFKTYTVIAAIGITTALRGGSQPQIGQVQIRVDEKATNSASTTNTNSRNFGLTSTNLPTLYWLKDGSPPGMISNRFNNTYQAVVDLPDNVIITNVQDVLSNMHESGKITLRMGTWDYTNSVEAIVVDCNQGSIFPDLIDILFTSDGKIATVNRTQ